MWVLSPHLPTHYQEYSNSITATIRGSQPSI